MSVALTSGVGLAQYLPVAPAGHSWSLDFGAVTDEKCSYEKVYVALLQGRETVRKGIIDVGMYGYGGAVEWARHALTTLTAELIPSRSAEGKQNVSVRGARITS